MTDRIVCQIESLGDCSWTGDDSTDIGCSDVDLREDEVSTGPIEELC